jgi:hypothetical protein
MQLIGETEAGNEYSVLGPETDAYNNNPPKEIHLVYLVGEAADVAEDNAEEATTIEELAPVAAHDVAAIVEALGEHAPESMVEEETTTSETSPPVEEASESGFFGLPAPGLISVVFVVLGAAMVASITPRRQEE